MTRPADRERASRLIVAQAPALRATAERVRRGRIARELSQLELAQSVTACGVRASRSLIGAIERCEVVASLGLRTALEQVLDDPGLADDFPDPVGSTRYTGEEVAEVVRRYVEEEQSGPAIASEMGLDEGTVYFFLRRANVQMRPSATPKYPRPEPRECPTCGKTFTPNAVAVANGYGRYHSRACARRSEEGRHAGRMAAIARHRAADEKVQCRKLELDALTLTEVAGDLRVSVNTVSTWIAKEVFPPVAREVIEGERTGFVRREAYERWKRDEWPRLRKQAESFFGNTLSGYPPGWSRRAKLRWQGRANGYKGATAGIEAGRAKGGRPSVATPEQQQQMLILDGQGLSTRKIAEQVFGERRLYKRVQRFLRR